MMSDVHVNWRDPEFQPHDVFGVQKCISCDAVKSRGEFEVRLSDSHGLERMCVECSKLTASDRLQRAAIKDQLARRTKARERH